MKKWLKFTPIIIGLLGLLIIVSLFLNKGLFYNIKDPIIWDAMKKNIVADNIALVTLSGYNAISFEDEDKGKIIYLLQSAGFKESNWRHFGPTAEAVLTITFKDRRYFHFAHWGGDTFETTSFGSQFLISSEELGALIEKYKKEKNR